jgi:alpha-tubulin suppressor-like RCC1 family protein
MTQSTVFFWGNNQHNLLSSNPTKTFSRPQCIPIPHNILDISSSEKHISFITQDGTLWSFGLNLDGRLGIGGKPDLKCGLTNPLKVKLNSRAIKVKCGFSHACVQLSNDELYSWGLGDYGALGTGEFKSRTIPGKVLLKGRITNFSCGAMHSGFVDT